MESTSRQFGIKEITWAVYALQALGLVTFVTPIIGFIVNLYKDADASADPLAKSHFRWQKMTFLWSLCWAVVAFATTWIFGLGVLVFGVAWCWSAYRTLRGMLKLSSGQPPKPGY